MWNQTNKIVMPQNGLKNDFPLQEEGDRDQQDEADEEENVPQQEDGEIQEVPVDQRILGILEGSRGRKNEPKYTKAGENDQVKEGGQWRQAAMIE